MNFSPTEEQNMVIEAARTFVRRELLPHEDIVEELNRVPDDLFEQIKKRSIEQGLFGFIFLLTLGTQTPNQTLGHHSRYRR